MVSNMPRIPPSNVIDSSVLFSNARFMDRPLLSPLQGEIVARLTGAPAGWAYLSDVACASTT